MKKVKKVKSSYSSTRQHDWTEVGTLAYRFIRYDCGTRRGPNDVISRGQPLFLRQPGRKLSPFMGHEREEDRLLSQNQAIRSIYHVRTLINKWPCHHSDHTRVGLHSFLTLARGGQSNPHLIVVHQKRFTSRLVQQWQSSQGWHVISTARSTTWEYKYPGYLGPNLFV